MRNALGQMDLLSESRDQIGTRRYALARERGQDNKQKMNNNKRNNIDTNPIGTTEVRYVHHNNIQKKMETYQHQKRAPYRTAGNADINSYAAT